MGKLGAALAIPIGVTLVTFVIIILVSRILLATNKAIAPPVALAISMAILIVCAILAARPGPDRA
jgi:hypothetical protein